MLSVKPGDGQDACRLCGIQRINAGFLKESCGEHYLKPGCFVEARDTRTGLLTDYGYRFG